MNRTHKAKILGVLRSQKLAVISTVHSSKPATESALIAFTEDDDLCIYFQTGKHTRKAANLANHPNVSLVIGLSLDDLVTVQYEGKAERLLNADDLEACRHMFIAKDSPTTEIYTSLFVGSVRCV